VYLAVAVAATAAGRDKIARAAFDAAIEAAKANPYPSEQAKEYAYIVAAAARARKIDWAEDVAELIPNYFTEQHSQARASIAQALASVGRIYEARRYCEGCQPIDKLWSYTVILTEAAASLRRNAASASHKVPPFRD
jgi:hypothetical protein